MIRLGSTIARLKLKGIDGGPHKRWSMWFNSKQREEPYPVLTSMESFRDEGVPACRNHETGAAWLSSARVVRCWVKSRNERNPCFQLPSLSWGLWKDRCGNNAEEDGDDVKSSWSLCPGLHTCYNGSYRGERSRDVERISEKLPKFGLRSATRPHEAGIASNRATSWRGEYVPGPCTHRPSSQPSGVHPKKVS